VSAGVASTHGLAPVTRDGVTGGNRNNSMCSELLQEPC